MTRNPGFPRKFIAWAVMLLSLMLAACGDLPEMRERKHAADDSPRSTDSRSARPADPEVSAGNTTSTTTGERPRRTRPAPAPRRCPPGQVIGVLAAEGSAVYINGAPAHDGDEVCDGDNVTTGEGSSAQVMLGDDREGDTVQLDANTDPRFRRLPSGCVLVDAIRRGRLLAEQRRTRACLIFEVQNKLYFQRAATVHIEAIPAGAAPARAEVSVIKGEVRPLQVTTAQVQTLRLEGLEKIKRAPVTMNNKVILDMRRPEAVQFQPSEVKRSADWTRQFKLKVKPLDLKTLPKPELNQ